MSLQDTLQSCGITHVAHTFCMRAFVLHYSFILSAAYDNGITVTEMIVNVAANLLGFTSLIFLYISCDVAINSSGSGRCMSPPHPPPLQAIRAVEVVTDRVFDAATRFFAICTLKADVQADRGCISCRAG